MKYVDLNVFSHKRDSIDTFWLVAVTKERP